MRSRSIFENGVGSILAGFRNSLLAKTTPTITRVAPQQLFLGV
ncbi:hypothetical protein Vi05172_g11212 [Venturia inaequalis]|nr:hypothetical protein Vi05172_g11212 [Venturia inaequalis]